MKKIIFLIIPFVLTSCFFSSNNNNDEVEKAKQEILGNEVSNNRVNNSVSTGTEEQTAENSPVEEIKPSYNISQVSEGDPLIEIDDLSGKDFYSGEVVITGKTKGYVDKINVSFSNKTSTYPSDLYDLKQFKSGDSTFRYVASSNFQTLDFGLNEYIFTAYSSGVITKINVEINLPEKIVKNDTTYKNIENLGDLSLPSSNEYGDPSLLSDSTIIYSNINNFYLRKDNVENIKCDTLTDYLTEVYNYSYWNTCRDIVKDKSIGYYVLRLEGDNYKYEKHYINYEKGLYGVLLLEEGTGVTSQMLQDKNNELKQQTFDQVLLVDKLFKEIK
nr:hypothetical protein [Candidatus Gracilibacteria bacterium]